MMVNLETPPRLTGSDEAQLQQLYSYLYRLSENLNVALNAMERNPDGVQSAITESPSGGSGDTYNELRALIVNTAEIVKSEFGSVAAGIRGDVSDTQNSIGELRGDLLQKTEAVSQQWGTFQENIQTEIQTAAEAVVQKYNYDAQLQTLKEQAAGFSEYQIRTEGSIRQGFIGYDESGVPILGIAIGQGLLHKTVVIDGKTYEELNPNQNMAFYTANKVSFRIGGQEVAYVSNRKLYIGDVEITGTIVVGRKWQMTTASGFVIKWVGGDG